jgi:aryl-alcohol dehydrogenase-like predicted oxidoreductase
VVTLFRPARALLRQGPCSGSSPVAQGAGLSLPTLALAWVLRRGEVASAITGASRPEQVHANAQASGVQLTADVLAAIDAALGPAPVKAPTLAPLAQQGVLHR